MFPFDNKCHCKNWKTYFYLCYTFLLMTRGKGIHVSTLEWAPQIKGKNIQAQLCVIANNPAQSHTKMLCHITPRTPLFNIHVPLKTHVSKFWYWESSNFLAGLGISFFEYEGDREKEIKRLLNKTTQRVILSVTISIIQSIKKQNVGLMQRRKMLLENVQNNSTWHKKSFSLWIEGYYVNNNQVFLGPTLDCVKDE